MLTHQQLDEFDRCGIVRIQSAIDAADAEAMCACVWDNLARRYGVRRDQPETWNGERLLGYNALDKSATFEQVGSARVGAMLDDLLGPRNWQRPQRWGSLLVTFPESREPWTVPRASWHLDFPASGAVEGLFSVRLFTCLAPLPHGGGATVVLAGSHRLAEQMIRGKADRLRSADVRNALIRADPFVRALCSHDETADRIDRFMNRGATVDGVELRVIEMTGEPGDVYFVHPLMLHAPAPNCATVPRIVLSGFMYRADVIPEALYAER